jgi:hypothetical protein
MTMNRWHWLMAAEVILAVSVVGEAGAQQRVIMQPQVLPPASREIIAPAPTGPVCAARRTPGLTIWNNWKGRLERWCVSEEPDVVPLGQSLYQTMRNKIDNGIAARMILNDFDFEPCSESLNLRGREKLGHLAGLALQYPYPIIVERTNYDPALSKRRVEMTQRVLAALNIPVQPGRVVEGGVTTPGLNGVEALILYGNLMSQTQSQGGGGAAPAVPNGAAQPNQIPGTR